MPGEKLEIELKFPVVDAEAVRAKLGEAGAQYKGKFDDENYFCDKPSLNLCGSGRILRIRRSVSIDLPGSPSVRLTYKEPVPDPRFKVRTEIEVGVDDFDGIRSILEHVGFSCRLGYRRVREIWDFAGVFITLDTLAFGQFVELEGNPDDIAAVAARLGFDMAAGSTKSYLTIAREAGA